MNSFGRALRVMTFGESHGKGIGCVIDGVPPRIEFDEKLIANCLARRRPGASSKTSRRDEKDEAELLSGVFEGRTTGMPLALWIANADQRSRDYSALADRYRPSHADYSWQMKYGIRDHRGGGRSSARETAARVAAGAVAQMVCRSLSLGASISVHGGAYRNGRLGSTKARARLESSPQE